MNMRLQHTELGFGLLTNEHPDHLGRAVFVCDGGAIHTTARGGYFHSEADGPREAQYSAGQLAWIDDLIVEWYTTPMPDGWSHFRDGMWRFNAGVSLKTPAQLKRIEQAKGRVLLA
jgi:hypothetical protein